MIREETKAKTFDVLNFVADNAGLSTFEAIEEAYNMGVSEQERMSEWIPIKTRPMTNEEKEKYRSMGWDDKRIEFMYDCQLPDDGQTVLVTDRLGFVSEDTFYNDDGCYFESNCDMNDIKAWMPLPSPYNAESEEK